MLSNRAKKIFSIAMVEAVALAMIAPIMLTGCNSNNVRTPSVDGKMEAIEKLPESEPAPQQRRVLPWSQVMSLPAAQQRRRDSYRLKPDSRFINAVTMIEKLLHSQRSLTNVNFANGKWHITIDDRLIGELPEFADFDQRFEILRNLAKTLIKQTNFSLPAGGSYDSSVEKLIKTGAPAQLLLAVEQTDAKWQKQEISTTQLALACHGLSLLTWEMEDRLDVGDAIVTKALTLNAISAALGNDVTEDIAILAHQMGYHAGAKALVDKLPAQNPFRLYLTNRKQELIKLVDQNPRDFKTSFCLLSLLSDNLLEVEWKKYAPAVAKANPGCTVPLLKTFLGFDDDEALLPISHFLLQSASVGVAADHTKTEEIDWSNLNWSYKSFAASANFQIKNLLEDFERNLAQRRTDSDQSLEIDPSQSSLDTVFYRGAFYSGVSLIATAYGSLPNAEESTKQFAKSLHTDVAGAASELVLFVNDELGISHRDFSEVMHDAISFKVLGPLARAATFSRLGTFYQSAHPEQLLAAGPNLFSCMDDRPSTRFDLSVIALRSLMDLSLQHRLFIASCQAGTPTNLSARFNGLIESRSFSEVYHFVSNVNLPHFVRFKLVEALRANFGSWRNPNALDRIYLTLAKEDPHDFSIVSGYYQYLVKAKKYEQARDIMKQWLAQQKNFLFLDQAKARTFMARASFAMGHHQLALQDLGNAATSGYEEAFGAKVAILQALGRADAAQQWSEQFVKSYPNDLAAISLYCSCLWKSGKYSEAAEYLRQHKGQLGTQFWRQSVGTILITLFDKSPQKLQFVIDALKNSGFKDGGTIGQIANQFYAHDLAELAFQVLASVDPQPEEVPDVATNAYRYLKRWRGKAAALDWLKRQVPLEHRASLAPFAFLAGQYELLFEFIPETRSGNDAANDVNLMRAAALLLKPDAISPTAKKSLAANFSSKTVTSAIGRYLVGQDTSIDRLELSSIDRCAAAFYVGWKTLCLGKDFYLGCDWLRIGLDSDEKAVNQYHWSSVWLGDIDLTLMQYPALKNYGTTRHLQIGPPSETGEWSLQRRFELNFKDTPAVSVSR